MGRNNKKYQKTLHQQAYDRLTGMAAFGQSKADAKQDGSMKGKIYSYSTYRSYWQHIKYFLKWIAENHSECTTLKDARQHVNEWLHYQDNLANDKSKHYSAWTIQLEAAALNKLFGIDKSDPDRFVPPRRRSSDIKRSRVSVKNDKHFSTFRNDELIRFCRGTGCRRNVLEKLEGQDYWPRIRMMEEVDHLKNKNNITSYEAVHLRALEEALHFFPDEKDFVLHRKDKGGKYRYAPIIGSDKEMIVERFKRAGQHEKVWLNVHSHGDYHGYRADYATALYKTYARPIQSIPYDRINKGSGHKYQSDVYYSRNGNGRYDKRALSRVSVALGHGHQRLDVVVNNYIRNL